MTARRLVPALLLALLISSPLVSVSAATLSTTQSDLPIKHIFIIVQENHSFDNYFGTYPGVDGLRYAMPQSNPNDSKLVAPFEINTPVLP
ncbi:MAG TPA: alkaline phosphatase family protein, partial [Nitrososphaerales archaeon]|nr:alkaline phosphatase family protein [Nitrososphaerales archaeon]